MTTSLSRVVYVGVDPGITGAMCLLDDDRYPFGLIKLPTRALPSGKKCLDGQELFNFFRSASSKFRFIVEDVHAMPKQGVTSMFSFGQTVGIIRAVTQILDLPTTYVAPQTWKKYLFGKGKHDKNVSVDFVESQIKKRVNHNFADAYCLAYYGKEVGL